MPRNRGRRTVITRIASSMAVPRCLDRRDRARRAWLTIVVPMNASVLIAVGFLELARDCAVGRPAAQFDEVGEEADEVRPDRHRVLDGAGAPLREALQDRKS